MSTLQLWTAMEEAFIGCRNVTSDRFVLFTSKHQKGESVDRQHEEPKERI